MTIQERRIVLNPEVESSKPKLENRDSIEYPRTDFKYNRTSAEITVEKGQGILILQQIGRDEDNRINVGVVEDFQSHIIGDGSKDLLKIPAGYWFVLYNTGEQPLEVKIDHNFPEAPVDGLEVKMPNLAFKLIRQENIPALLPTLRVSEIRRANRGGIPYAYQDRRDRNIMPGWHGKT